MKKAFCLIMYCLAVLSIALPLFGNSSLNAGEIPVISGTDFIDGDILSIDLPSNPLNKKRFVAATTPGSDEILLFTDFNVISIFDGQTLLEWLGQDNVFEAPIESGYARGEYNVFLLEVPNYVNNPLKETGLWELESISFNINPTVVPPVVPPVVPTINPVDLGTAGNFVILAKSAVSTTGVTAITGDIGLSPAAASFVTGFGLIADSTNTFSTSSLVTGKIYAANYVPPTPANLTTAVSDMETAFIDVAGRTSPDFTEYGAGDISGETLAPGLYKWGTGVLITGVGVTISGDSNDVWIFQIAQDLTVSNGAIVTLSGGAQAKNVFWQVSGQVNLGTAVKFNGIILSKTLISMNTGTEIIGRAFAQTAVTLDATTIITP